MIKIIDNFFDEKLFLEIKNHVTTKVMFTPRFFEKNKDGTFVTAKDKNKDNYYGDRFILLNDQKLRKCLTEQCEKKFKLKIKTIHDDSAIDLRNLDRFVPHQDSISEEEDKLGFQNILIYLAGPTAVSNGTVFYTKEKETLNLDIHVGFRENRAVMFPASWYHSPHASNVPNMRRYSASIFVLEYQEN
jgi:hypothetical protein